MKYLPLIRAAIRRRPFGFVLLFLSALFAYVLLGFAAEGGNSLPLSEGSSMKQIVLGIALGGLVLILVLAWNAISHSVRARRKELSVLRALGFPPFVILALVWAEAAIPCIAGAGLGLVLADFLVRIVLDLLPRGHLLPSPRLPGLVLIGALASALAVSLAGTVLPVRGILRLNLAHALAGTP